MEASFLPKVQGQGGKQKEHSHSLLFDSAMTDKVLRQNAYEERLLLKRTEHIEKQKQQTLEEHNFCKSQFLLRFMPVVKRQSELRKELLSKVFDSENPSGEKAIAERNRPLSSYPHVKSRTSTANEKVKPRHRRTVSAELRFPALQEDMDDILNGYRTTKPQPKSVSPTKMRFRGDLESRRNTSQAGRHETSLPKKLTPERKIRSKGIDFGILKDRNVEDTDHLTNNTLTFDCPKMSKDKVTENFTTVSVDENSTKNSQNFVAEDNHDRTVQQETTITLESPEEEVAKKKPSKHSTKSVKILNEDSGVVNDDSCMRNSFPRQLRIFQNDNKLPEKLLKDFIHTLKSDTTASNTARFLAKMLNSDGNSNFSCLNENPGSLVSLQLGNSNGIHLLSDVKKRQRHEAQRLRIMRTIVLAYDTVWNERVKKISTAA
jgi:hypothetical protein